MEFQCKERVYSSPEQEHEELSFSRKKKKALGVYQSLDPQGPIFTGELEPAIASSTSKHVPKKIPKASLKYLPQIIVQFAIKVKLYFEPAVGMVLTQHAGHKLLSKHEIIEKAERDLPPLLGCKEAPEDCVVRRQRGSDLFIDIVKVN